MIILSTRISSTKLNWKRAIEYYFIEIILNAVYKSIRKITCSFEITLKLVLLICRYIWFDFDGIILGYELFYDVKRLIVRYIERI